jgi:hypothetical protein
MTSPKVTTDGTADEEVDADAEAMEALSPSEETPDRPETLDGQA